MPGNTELGVRSGNPKRPCVLPVFKQLFIFVSIKFLINVSRLSVNQILFVCPYPDIMIDNEYGTQRLIKREYDIDHYHHT